MANAQIEVANTTVKEEPSMEAHFACGRDVKQPSQEKLIEILYPLTDKENFHVPITFCCTHPVPVKHVELVYVLTVCTKPV